MHWRSEGGLAPRRGLLSKAVGWLALGLWRFCQALLITWASLAIYYSNLPRIELRLALAVSFAAFAIWALCVLRQRSISIVFALLFLCVVAWWIAIPPSHDREWRPEVAEGYV